MKKQFLLLCFCFLAAHLLAQSNYLTVSDVRKSWLVYQGTIEKATLSVRPQGLYMEYGLYLTFSSRGINFGASGDSIEVVLNFTLPEGAIVHDSWLWVGEDIVRARILDAWSATNIYEGIVKRRQDPSILTKKSATQYQLRVFPMHKSSTRRVKITWLQAADIYRDRTEATLPFHILQTSYNVVPGLNLLVWPDAEIKNPVMPSYPQMSFETVSDSLAGLFHRAFLPPDAYSKAPRLQMSSPLKNGYYLSSRTDNDEGFYQLAVLPSAVLQQKRQKKLAVLFDYEKKTTAISSNTLLVEVKNALLAKLEPTDSFNLFFSSLSIGKAANRWLPAHPDTINKVFQQLSSPLSDYSNLQSLLVTGIQWVRQYGSDAKILLVSNSSHLSNFQTANPLLNDITALNQPTVPIHVVNFNQEASPQVLIGGSYYYANGYFLYNLAGLNDGVYQQTLSTQTLGSALSQIFNNLEQYIQSFDMHTSVEGGLCYGRFDIASGNGSVALTKPLTQLGKLKGSGTFRVDMSGILDGKIIQTQINIPNTNILPADTLLREMWHGRYIQMLESQLQINSITAEILFKSLTERVLSRYSAFLCIENPEWICEGCDDETKLVSTQDLASRDSTLTAFPNPFTDRTTISVELPSEKGTGQVTLEIYGADGRLVRLFDLNLQDGSNQTVWDGTNADGQSVPSGTYICMLRANGQTRVMRLMKM